MKLRTVVILALVVLQVTTLNLSRPSRHNKNKHKNHQNSKKNPPLSVAEAEEKGVCHELDFLGELSESMFEFPLFQSVAKSTLKHVLKKLDDVILDVNLDIEPVVSACYGKFKGIDLKKMGNTLCDTIPIANRNSVKLVGFGIEDILCPTDLTQKIEASLCLMGDVETETFAIASNVDLANCFSSYLAEPPNPLATIFKLGGIISNASIGVSIKRELERPVWIPNMQESHLVVEKTVANGHVFIEMKSDISTYFMDKILKFITGGKKSSLMKLKGKISFLIDLGSHPVQNVVDYIHGNAEKVILNLKDSFPESEIHIKTNGQLKVKLEDLSFGFFPDLKFNFGCELLISSGRDVRGEIREPGVYMYNHFKGYEGLESFIVAVLYLYKEPFAELGITLPELERHKDGNFGLSVAFTKKYVAFSFDISNVLTLSCTKHFKGTLECLKLVNKKIEGSIEAKISAGQIVFKTIKLGVEKVFNLTKEKFNNSIKFLRKIYKKGKEFIGKGIETLQNFVSEHLARDEEDDPTEISFWDGDAFN